MDSIRMLARSVRSSRSCSKMVHSRIFCCSFEQRAITQITYTIGTFSLSTLSHVPFIPRINGLAENAGSVKNDIPIQYRFQVDLAVERVSRVFGALNNSDV